jgi:hypothetical protein
LSRVLLRADTDNLALVAAFAKNRIFLDASHAKVILNLNLPSKKGLEMGERA